MKHYARFKEALSFFLPYWKKGAFPVFTLVVLTVISFIYPLFPKWALDEVVAKENTRLLPLLVALITALVLLQRLFSYLKQVTFYKFERRSILDIQEKLIDRILNYPLEFFTRNHSGYILGRIRGDVGGLSLLFSETLVLALLEFLSFFGALIILYSMSAKLTAICCIPIPFILFEIYRNRAEIKRVNKNLILENANVSKELSDTFQGIEVIKAQSRETEGKNRTKSILERYQELQIEQKIVVSKYNNTITLFANIGRVLLLYFGIMEVVFGAITIGTYMAFALYLGFLYSPVTSVSRSFVLIDRAKRSYDRIDELFKLLPEDSGSADSGDIGTVEIKGLHFSYDGKKHLFKGIDFAMKKGDRVLLQGKSGSGKSTLTKLLLGLYRPKEGEIYFNGIPLKDLDLKKLRKRIGFISQSTFLFNKTIRENIAFTGSGYSDEDVLNILEKCEIKEKVLSLENGLEHVLSEKGDDFSGGEKQRLSLARALIKQPGLIIMDEATSNIDKETKEKIEDIIYRDSNDKIIIEISHRDGSQKRFNKFLDLELENREDTPWNIRSES